MVTREESVFQVGRILKIRRKSLKMSRKEVALLAQITPTYLSMIENGHREPAMPMLGRLLDVLGLELVFKERDIVSREDEGW